MFSFPSQYSFTIDILAVEQENEISFTKNTIGVTNAQR